MKLSRIAIHGRWKMKSNFLSIIIIFLLLNTVLFAAEVQAPSKDNAYSYQPYLWVFDDIGLYFANTMCNAYGQHYPITHKYQGNNPGTNPTCKVSVVKADLESHNYGAVWWAAHANDWLISAEPYGLTPAGEAARDAAYWNYIAQGYAGLIARGVNYHAYSISITDLGLQTWFKTPSTLDSALVYFWGCSTYFLSGDCGAGVFIGYDIHIDLSSLWDADVFWERMNGEHELFYRSADFAVIDLADGHLRALPNYNPYLSIALAPYVEMVTFGPYETSGSVWFDIRMNTTQYAPEDIISVTGAEIVNAYWSYFDTKLNFEIDNVTQNTQNYTVHHDKAIAKNLVTTTRLDGNQNPPGTNGHGPNCDDYKFVGYAQTGIVEAENAFESGFTTCLKTLSPNPGYGKIDINYQIANPTATKITIFDCSGRIVKSIKINDDTGNHTVIWDGVDALGREVTNGCYFVKFEANDYKVIKKLVLIK